MHFLDDRCRCLLRPPGDAAGVDGVQVHLAERPVGALVVGVENRRPAGARGDGGAAAAVGAVPAPQRRDARRPVDRDQGRRQLRGDGREAGEGEDGVPARGAAARGAARGVVEVDDDGRVPREVREPQPVPVQVAPPAEVGDVLRVVVRVVVLARRVL
eukprot:gene2-biopygen1332